jgi:hypothetical protein
VRRVLLVVLLLVGHHPVFASGVGATVPWPLDPYGGRDTERAAFHDGHVGVLMGRSPWSQLFEAWRLLHRLPVGAEAGAVLDEPCCDRGSAQALTDAQQAWVEARKLVPGATPTAWYSISAERDIGNFVFVPNCLADAFATAAQTLRDRIAAHGAGDAGVKSWLVTQDAVFVNCAKDADLPPLGADPPEWLKADRDYQEAAAELYRRHFAEAAKRFTAIGGDGGSPWRKFGPYLSARAAILAVRANKGDTAMIAAAQENLTKLAAPDAYGHDLRALLIRLLEFRTEPDRIRRELAETLVAPTLSTTAAFDFRDSRLLGRSSDGTPEYLDWITVFGRIPDEPQAAWFEHFAVDQPWKTDADALRHARERWSATGDTAWLIAALAWSSDPAATADLIAASRQLQPDDPAFLTAAYHRLRLTLAADRHAARAELDTILARQDLSITSRNLFLAERAMVARDEKEFAQLASRASPCARVTGVNTRETTCIGWDYRMEGYEQVPSIPGFGAEALPAIDRMPLDQRARLAADASLPAPLRLDVALTTWTRAALLENATIGDPMARLLSGLLPQLATEWTSYLSASNRDEKRIAAWFLLVKLPGAAVDLADPVRAYNRPTGSVPAFQGHWPDWRVAARGGKLPPVEPAAVSDDRVCFGLCSPGKFEFRVPDFIAAGAVQAAAERGGFAPDPSTAGLSAVWEELLGYVRAHPGDPRSPEALYWLIRVSRYGTGHNRSSYRAFQLLHERYPGSTWAKQSKYFYD